MRTSWLKLYAPFLGLALVQALFIAIAPSLPSDDEVAAGFEGPLPPGLVQGGDGVFVDPETGEAFNAEGESLGTTGTTGRRSGGSSTSGSGAGTAGGGGSGGGGTGGGGAGVPAGDTSHCVGDRQFDILHSDPPCAPSWPDGADNGGATYQGVTAEEIKIVFFGSEANPLVDSILASQGLARTDQDEEVLFAAATEFINEHYELYGRKITIIEEDQNPCPQTPPDPPPCIEAARAVVTKHKPFMVLWDSPLYPTVFNEFARLGVVTLGGWHFSEEFFTDFRPLRYDVFMDGTKSARMLAEYYCKNLAGQNATHSGQIIHRSIGARGAVPRRLGISVPDTDANRNTAEFLKSMVMECDPGAVEPLVRAYQSDIERAEQQANATAAAYIDGGVTTITCLCDPIAPVYGSNAYTRNNYFPEHLIAGIGLIDFDKLGRLYDSQQWTHAFGPSHLQVQPRHEDSDATRMWRATGRSGTPCESCNLPWAYVALAASMIQGAGPNLNPVNIERGVQNSPGIGGWERSGGNPHVVKVTFAPGDYTGIDDLKEVYWSETETSTIDGRAPSYVNVDGGRRYEEGQIPGGFGDRIPVKPQ